VTQGLVCAGMVRPVARVVPVGAGVVRGPAGPCRSWLPTRATAKMMRDYGFLAATVGQAPVARANRMQNRATENGLARSAGGAVGAFHDVPGMRKHGSCRAIASARIQPEVRSAVFSG
jgi:hypothetical protein